VWPDNAARENQMRGPAVAVVVGLLLGSAARAEDTRAQARVHFEQGRKLYQVGDYAPALDEFKRAFLLKEDPVFIFNIAQCHRQLGDVRQAIVFYRRYLGTNPPATHRRQVEKLIADLEHGQPAPPADPAPPPDQGVTLRPAAPPPEAPVARLTRTPPPPPRDEPLYTRWWFWTGAAALVVGGVMGGLVLSRRTVPSGCSAGLDYCASLRP
jgi:hypothetical protein